MANQNEKTFEDEVDQVPSDPWIEAFAALDKEAKDSTEEASDTDDSGSDSAVSDSQGDDNGEHSASPEVGDGLGSEDQPGGPGDLGGGDSGSDTAFDNNDLSISEEQIKQYRESFMEDIKERTLNDVANAYIKQGARHTNGRLGASINDPDVCVRDDDGFPRFYNPETGREFTGDNPRRQAQEWVDDYNRELADAFNKTCREYSQRLMQEEGGRLAVIEFAPKYKSLDPIRRSMLDSILEDYEITDSEGDVIAYSCDLDKALAAVNRQVRVIQSQYKSGKTEKPKPSGPALDTPNAAGSKAPGSGKPKFKSIEEAMEWEQDQLLAKMKGNAR